MLKTHILTALGFGIVLGIPACGGKFVSLGNDDAGVGGHSGAGGGSVATGGGSVDCSVSPCPASGGTPGGSCLYDGVTYSNGKSFKSSDGCNSCSCSNGNVLCTEMACLATGGAPGVGGSSGVCTCTGAVPNYLIKCADGSTVGPECSVDANGTCNWTTPPCPTQATGGATGAGGSTGVTCLYNNQTYTNGTSFKSTDSCNTCSCGPNGNVTCTELPCPLTTGGATGAGGSTGVTCVYNNQTIPSGSNMKSTDGCNTCSCTSTGQMACTAMACLATGGTTGAGGSTSTSCPPINLPAITCTGYKLTTDPTTGCVTGFTCPTQDAGVCTCTSAPPPVAYQLCADGSTVSPVCVADSTGSCGWVVRGCTADAGTCTCTGAKPTYEIKCTDGTIVGPVCTADSAGTCNWTTPICPTSSSGGAASVSAP